jgi:uncharacterized repeat protein (TIGR03803 family)
VPLAKFLSISALAVTLLLATFSIAADKESIIYSFDRASGGYASSAGLYIDSSGNLFGLGNSGVLFELSPDGSGSWTYTELSSTTCAYPTGPLVRDKAGNFYSANFFGSVYQFSEGAEGWVSTLIYQINDVSGFGPSSLLVDSTGNLYGVDGLNGANGFGYVFELSPTNAGTWSLTDLHDFNGPDGNASNSGNSASGELGGLIVDASGSLYGVTFSGGSNSTCGSGCGVVFKLTKKSGAWTESVLHTFNGANGVNPDASLLLDAAGNLYGTTSAGGSAGFGVVFEIALVSGKPLTHVLHNFTNSGGDGAYLQAPLIMDAAGSLYGTTSSGGSIDECSVEQDQGCGMAFKLSPVGQQWKESLLHAFRVRGDGAFPSPLVADAAGHLYGDSAVGGREDLGVVFELFP